MDNPSIRKVLREGECQLLTTRRQCDCGTVLGVRPDPPEVYEDKLAKEEARLRRKGWSEAKIARAIEDHRKADARPLLGHGPDSLELWDAALHDLREELKLPYVGLFFRMYSGGVSTEKFSASRRDVPKSVPWRDAFISLEEDEVTIFR